MKIVSIFAPHLHSFEFDDSPDELSRLFDFWTDEEQLNEYFEINNEVLKHEKVDIEEAITQTIENADLLYDLLSQNRANLDGLFQNLSANSSHVIFYLSTKQKKDGCDYTPLKLISTIM
jgi:hypothetical protein